MRVIPVTAILRTNTDGIQAWVGWVQNDTAVPESLMTARFDALDLEDGSNMVWLLAVPQSVPLFDVTAMANLEGDEVRCKAISKLTDVELASLGLVRA